MDGRKIDFLFIDGDHSYEGVKADFRLYSGFVRESGMIVFHDIIEEQLPESVCGVGRFWSEIKPYYQHIEIVEDYEQQNAGIAILFYDPEVYIPEVFDQ